MFGFVCFLLFVVVCWWLYAARCLLIGDCSFLFLVPGLFFIGRRSLFVVGCLPFLDCCVMFVVCCLCLLIVVRCSLFVVCWLLYVVCCLVAVVS